MTTAQFRLPDVGEGLTEADIVTWRVAAGDQVQLNDMIVEIETAKSLVELPSPFAGTVTALLVPEGATVPVGTPIIEVDDGLADDRPVAAGGADVGAAASASARPEPNLVGYGPRAASVGRRARRSSPATPMPSAAAGFESATPTSPQVPPEPPAPRQRHDDAPTSRALAKPPVRKLAKDLGVDLAALTPSGPSGTVTRADVLTAVASTDPAMPAAAESTAPAQVGERETRIELKGVRKRTAQAMVASAFSAPHVTEWVEVDVTRTVEMVARMRTSREFRDVKVTPLLLVARAVCVALRRTPELNSTLDDATGEIVRKHYVNLGIAADTPRGLVVPVIPDADRLGTRALADAIVALTQIARAGRTQPAQMSGGTFTITNVGVFGIDGGTPILNPGESGILAVGAIRAKPWVVDDQVVPRSVATLSVSFDHRVVDGAEGSVFLADVAAILHDPGATLVLG